MYIFVLIVHVIVSLVLIAVILLQAGRGGIAEAFGGGATQSVFGTRTATLLSRATAVCATVFILTSLSLTVLSGYRSRSLMERAVFSEQGAGAIPSVPSAPSPTEPLVPEQMPSVDAAAGEAAVSTLEASSSASVVGEAVSQAASEAAEASAVTTTDVPTTEPGVSLPTQ